MDVAVGHVPEDHVNGVRPLLRHFLAQMSDGFRHAIQRNADVEADFLRQEATVFVGRFAVGPEPVPVGARLSDHGVLDQVLFIELAQEEREGVCPLRILAHIGLDQERDVVLVLEGWRKAADLGRDRHEFAPHRLEDEQAPWMLLLKLAQDDERILEARDGAKSCLKTERLRDAARSPPA